MISNGINQKYAEYQIDGNTIVLKNSFFGKETILLDGKKVSSKFSVEGTWHHFQTNGDTLRLKTSYNPYSFNNHLGVKIFKDDKLIKTEIHKMTLQSIIKIGLMVLLGIGSYQLAAYLAGTLINS